MKKIFVSILALTAIIGISETAFAASGERGFISVSTSANTEIAPDVAEISFAIKTTDGKSMQKATQLNKETSDKVLAALGTMLTPANGDYIKTSDYNASPVYTYSSGKRNFEKYEVSNRVIVHTKSINQVGNLIDKAIEAGATNVDSLNFSVSTYDAQCNDLLGIATQKAQTRANVVAKNLGTTLDGIKSLNVSCNANSSNNNPRMYLAKNVVTDGAVTESASGSSTSISSGVIKIYANVNANFYVK